MNNTVITQEYRTRMTMNEKIERIVKHQEAYLNNLTELGPEERMNKWMNTNEYTNRMYHQNNEQWTITSVPEMNEEQQHVIIRTNRKNTNTNNNKNNRMNNECIFKQTKQHEQKKLSNEQNYLTETMKHNIN